MTTTPHLQPDEDRVAEVPRVCRPLFVALVRAMLYPFKPLSVAADMVQADPATAMLLRDTLEASVGGRLEADGTIYDAGFRPLMLEPLISMIGRTEGNRLLHEMENDDPAR